MSSSERPTILHGILSDEGVGLRCSHDEVFDLESVVWPDILPLKDDRGNVIGRCRVLRTGNGSVVQVRAYPDSDKMPEGL
jgi:hypothetical protein